MSDHSGDSTGNPNSTQLPTLKPQLSSGTAASLHSAPSFVGSANGANSTGNTTPPNVVNNLGLRVLRPETYVGFDSLPDQFVARVVRDGFGFNLMALGATGMGKTTLLESLFNTKFSAEGSTRTHSLSSVSISTQQIELNEGSIKLKLNLIESKGFGDQIDKCTCVLICLQYCFKL